MDRRAPQAAEGRTLPAPAEYAEAIAGLDSDTVAHARTLVRRGEVATDVATARLVVATVRQQKRQRRKQTWLAVGAGVVGAGWIANFVSKATGDDPHHPNYFSLVLAAGYAGMIVEGVRRSRRGPRAERLNREFLERAGEPFEENATPASVAAPMRLFWGIGIALFVVYTGFFGVVISDIDGWTLPAAGVLVRAVPLGALLVGVTFVWPAWRRTSRPPA